MVFKLDAAPLSLEATPMIRLRDPALLVYIKASCVHIIGSTLNR